MARALRLAPLALALLAAGCASAPPVAVATDAGLVRGADPAAVAAVARALAIWAPRMRRALELPPGAGRAPVVWIAATPTVDGVLAVTYTTRIVLGRDALRWPDPYLAHELVHWWIDASPYRGLPHFVEEGLAMALSYDLLPDDLARHAGWLTRNRDATATPQELELTPQAWHRLPRADAERLTALGYRAVRRVGLPRLRALAAARAPPDAYLAPGELAPAPR